MGAWYIYVCGLNNQGPNHKKKCFLKIGNVTRQYSERYCFLDICKTYPSLCNWNFFSIPPDIFHMERVNYTESEINMNGRKM